MKIFSEIKSFFRRKRNQRYINKGRNESNIGHGLPTKSILDIVHSSENYSKSNCHEYPSNLKTPTSPPFEEIFVPVSLRSDKQWLYALKKYFRKVFKRKQHLLKLYDSENSKDNDCTSMELVEQNVIVCVNSKLEYSKLTASDSKTSSDPIAVACPDVLLPPIKQDFSDKKTFIIDLDETLVHSSFKPSKVSTLRVDVSLDNRDYRIYVVKRPYIDLFLRRVGGLFECVLFTASLGKYAQPVADSLDKTGAFQHLLFREACTFYNGSYVKDLSRLGRNISQTVILDNFPNTYMFHPENAIPITSWYDDMSDTALRDIIPYCEALAKAPNVPDFLRSFKPPVSVTAGYDPVAVLNRSQRKNSKTIDKNQVSAECSANVQSVSSRNNISKIVSQVEDDKISKLDYDQ